ncbi:MAG TPA: GTP-binding protein, partial [bacterium]|nr:GTP-binding protein [bacterium]
GHIDFTVEVERSLRVLDGAIIIFCGVGGVEPQSETVWHQADRYKIPRIAYINKLDRLGADFERVVKMIKNRLKSKPVVINFPIGCENNFKGVIDVIKQKAYYWDQTFLGVDITELEIPAAYKEVAAAKKSELIEVLSDYDDEIMSSYLEGLEISEEKIKSVLRKATLSNSIVPVLCGSSLKNTGVQFLLDAVLDYLPSPLDIEYITGHNVENQEILVKRRTLPSEPFTGLIFKIVNDSFFGNLLIAEYILEN